MDLKVILSNDKLITNLYSKSTDCPQYLHYGSCHPEQFKRSIVHIQALRIERVRSHESDFNDHSLNLRPWFSKQGYPEKIIDTEMSKQS